MKIQGDAFGETPTLVLISGGVDSSVLMNYVVQRGGEGHVGLSFLYPGMNLRRVEAAAQVCSFLEVTHKTIEIPTDLYPASIPKLIYAQMLVLAVAPALSNHCGAIAWGVSGEDSFGVLASLDKVCGAIERAVKLSSNYEIAVRDPFREMTKKAILENGIEIGLPFHLPYVCERGGEEQCGKCMKCVELDNALKKVKPRQKA